MRDYAFTLLEVIVVIIILAILVSISMPLYHKTVESARGEEAKTSLKLIQARERIIKLERNSYINCTSTLDCNNATRLGLQLSANNWDYNVTDATATNFLATADRIGTGGYLDCVYTINSTLENATAGASCP